MTKEDQAFWEAWNNRTAKGRELVKQGHFPECYKVVYPDDENVFCTCVRGTCPDE